jgi:hypothetical protein
MLCDDGNGILIKIGVRSLDRQLTSEAPTTLPTLLVASALFLVTFVSAVRGHLAFISFLSYIFISSHSNPT